MASELAAREDETPYSDAIPLVDQDSGNQQQIQKEKNHRNMIIMLLIFSIILIIVIIIIFTVIYKKDNQTSTQDKCNGYNNDLIVVAFDGLRWDYLTDEYESKWDIDLVNFKKIVSTGAHIKKLQPVMPTLTYPNFYTLSTGLYPGWHGIPWNTFYDPLLNNWKNKSNDDDHSGIWWLSDPIWTSIQNNKKLNNKALRSAVIYWTGSRSNNNNNGNNNGFPDWYLEEYQSDLDFYLRSDYLLNELNESDYNLGMIYYNEPDHIAHEYGPDSNNTAQILQYCDTVLGYLINELDELYATNGRNGYNLIIVSDHGFTECVLPSPLIIDMNMTNVYLDKFFQNGTLRFDTTFEGSVSAPQLAIKINYELFSYDPIDYFIDLLNKSIVNGYLYQNELFWIYKKGEIPYEMNRGSLDYRLSDIVVDVKLGYEWNIIGSTKYNRNVTCGGGHSWNNTELDMQTTLIAKGPDFKQNYTKEYAKNIHLYELMCKLMCETEPHLNNGSLDEMKDILIEY